MSLLRKIDHLCAALERAAIVVLFSALVLLISLNIVSRGLFQTSFHKILEFVPTLVLWLALAGASLALREGRHIKIELVLRFCSRKFRRHAARVTAILGMTVMGLLFFASLEFVRNEIAIFGPVGGLSVIFVIFFGLSSLRFLIRAVDPDGRSAPVAPPCSGAGLEGDPPP